MYTFSIESHTYVNIVIAIQLSIQTTLVACKLHATSVLSCIVIPFIMWAIIILCRNWDRKVKHIKFEWKWPLDTCRGLPVDASWDEEGQICPTIRGN